MHGYFSVVWKACDSTDLKNSKDLLADVLKEEKLELPVGKSTMNTSNCMNIFQSFGKPETISFMDEKIYWLTS